MFLVAYSSPILQTALCLPSRMKCYCTFEFVNPDEIQYPYLSHLSTVKLTLAFAVLPLVS
jgi:hypothetical protein